MSTMPLLKNFRINLWEAMRARNITVAKLASDVKLNRVTVSRILNGHLTPSLDTCENLARAAGMRPDTAFLEPLENLQRMR